MFSIKRFTFYLRQILKLWNFFLRFYTIVAPKSLRPYSDYQASITLHDDVEPTNVNLCIQGPNYKNEKQILVTSNRTSLISLHVNELDVSLHYKFVVKILSGINLWEESDLNVQSKNVSIFIQTDKSVYKPGDTIKFRVLVLDDKLRPVSLPPNSPLNIYLTDAENNRVKQWLKATPKKGVFTGEVPLSEFPLLGNWKLEAEVGGDKKTKDIEVAEYKQPKFDVKIDSPNEFSAKNGKVRAIIRSTGRSGQLIKGAARATLTPHSNSLYHDRYQYTASKSIPIDGKGTVEFDVDNDLNPEFSRNMRSQQYNLTATVMDQSTGQSQSASKVITLHQLRYKIHPTIPSHRFDSGRPLTFPVKITFL